MNVKPVFFFAVAALGCAALFTSPGMAGGSFHGGTFGFSGGSKKFCHTTPPVIKIWNYNKNININKNLNFNKNINLNKNININKNIVIAKSNSISVAVSGAAAGAAGYSSSGSYAETTVINRGGGEVSAAAEESCEMQEASVVKAIHAMCVSAEGREFPASHMLPETWIDTTYEGEVARCIAGSTLKITVGDVLQSDQGLAGTYEQGEVLACGRGESLWHYKNGMVKCGPAVPVKDCTERTNLRKYGTGDFFFSYRSRVCINRLAKSSSTTDLSSTSWDGGVGGSSD
ncbi:MAG TPA: hypothetical protein VLC74_08300 [Rhizomicrobium sp.]|nr:hypothetical protein [Rhizomicrobium sp.]